MAAAVQNKRKRDSNEVPSGRPAPGMNPATTNTTNNDFDQSYLDAGNDGLNPDDGVMDFTNLDQHDDNVNLADASNNPNQQQQNAPNTATSQRSGAGMPNSTNNNSSDTAAAAMAHYHTMTVPQPTEQTFMQSADGGPADSSDKQGGSGDVPGSENRRMPAASFAEFVQGGDAESGGEEDGSPGQRDSMGGMLGGGRNKPSVGSEEWHKQRKDNHKEVERRRRETINEGITELARIVPGCEKNKGSILSRAVQFITQLKDNESQNIEKWTLEKLLTEQAINELSSSCDKLKAECQRAWAECEAWKKGAQAAGVATVEVPPPVAVVPTAGEGAEQDKGVNAADGE